MEWNLASRRAWDTSVTPVPVPLEFGKSGDGERGGEGVIYTWEATDWLRKKLHFDTDTGPTFAVNPHRNRIRHVNDIHDLSEIGDFLGATQKLCSEE